MLKRGLELLAWLEEDLENVGAEDYHQLMRALELKHRALTSQCVTEHTMFREETRWPGYYSILNLPVLGSRLETVRQCQLSSSSFI